MNEAYDLVVIGAGPVGLYASFFGASQGLRVALVDALPDVGGQLTALYPQKFIFDVAGYPQVTATELVEVLRRQVAKEHVTVMPGFKVISLLPDGESQYQVVAEDGRSVRAKFVIIAAGSGMIVPRKLELAEAEKYVGRGLEYVVTDIENYRNQRVLIIGGGDTALDWANFLQDIAAQVTLIHRSEKFVGFEGSLRQLQQSACQIFTDAKLTAIFGDVQVERVEITNTRENWNRQLEISRILGCIGFTPKLGFIKEAGLEIAEGSIHADARMRTSLERVYAVGDIANHPGRIKLISTGFGNVQIAINDIITRQSTRSS
jgi:ferredoxin/flavodoxin---NADP+ reductase